MFRVGDVVSALFFDGQWYDCKLEVEMDGGFKVKWVDRDERDTFKTLKQLRPINIIPGRAAIPDNLAAMPKVG
eukprot:2898227-Rhodomonas_salina.1